MHFSRALLVGASFVVAAVAQTKIAFTQIPAAVVAGTPTTLRWSGGDSSSPVTITLKKGDPSNLATISIITGDATGNSFDWTPSASLPNGDDYALMISQGIDNINYSGEFPLTGGSTAAPSTTAVPSTSLSPSASISAVLSSLNGTLSSIIANSSSVAITSVTITASASGTGIPVSRNTTFVSQTLTAASSSTTGVVVTETTSTATGSSTAGGSSSSPSASTTAGAAGRLGSPLAFVLSAVAAIVYLN